MLAIQDWRDFALVARSADIRRAALFTWHAKLAAAPWPVRDLDRTEPYERARELGRGSIARARRKRMLSSARGQRTGCHAADHRPRRRHRGEWMDGCFLVKPYSGTVADSAPPRRKPIPRSVLCRGARLSAKRRKLSRSAASSREAARALSHLYAPSRATADWKSARLNTGSAKTTMHR